MTSLPARPTERRPAEAAPPRAPPASRLIAGAPQRFLVSAHSLQPPALSFQQPPSGQLVVVAVVSAIARSDHRRPHTFTAAGGPSLHHCSQQTRMSLNSSALYVPVITPPTPAPSPGPNSQPPQSIVSLYRHEFSVLPPYQRRQFLSAILNDCTPDELLFVSTTVAPLLKRDFLRELPPELAIHILGFIDDPRSLLNAGEVSRYWHAIASEECLWKALCEAHDFYVDADEWDAPDMVYDHAQPPSPISPAMNSLHPQSPRSPPRFSYYTHFKMSYEGCTYFL